LTLTVALTTGQHYRAACDEKPERDVLYLRRLRSRTRITNTNNRSILKSSNPSSKCYRRSASYRPTEYEKCNM